MFETFHEKIDLFEVELFGFQLNAPHPIVKGINLGGADGLSTFSCAQMPKI